MTHTRSASIANKGAPRLSWRRGKRARKKALFEEKTGIPREFVIIKRTPQSFQSEKNPIANNNP
jgi:hypothetical protein